MSKVKKKKSQTSNIIPILIFMGIGALCGLFGVKIIDDSFGNGNSFDSRIMAFIWLIICIYLAIFIQIVVHESGHLIFGKLSGYQFVSFRIGSIMLIKENGKMKLKRYNIVGTGGQCLMMPPQRDQYHFPYRMYNLGGSLTNIIIAVLCLALYYQLKNTLYLSILLVLLFIIGIAFALMNAIPMRMGGIANDGYNALHLDKDEEARRGFWLQLQVVGLMANGTRFKDMPSDWFELKDTKDLANPMIGSIGLLRCNYLHDKKLFQEAKELCEELLNTTGILEILKNELRCELLFYEIMDQGRQEVIESLYTDQLKKYIKATSSYVSRRRWMYAYALLVVKDKELANKEMDLFHKAAKTYPFKTEIESELETIQLIKDRVYDDQN